MPTVYIDADACPVKDEVYRVARRYGMRVAVVANAPLRVPADALIELVVRPGFGGADDWIAEQSGAGDVVVTADVPLAARCLGRGARVLDPKGRPFTDRDIGAALATRDLMDELPGRHRHRRPGPDDAEGPLSLPVEAGRGGQRRSPRSPAVLTREERKGPLGSGLQNQPRARARGVAPTPSLALGAGREGFETTLLCRNPRASRQGA